MKKYNTSNTSTGTIAEPTSEYHVSNTHKFISYPPEFFLWDYQLNTQPSIGINFINLKEKINNFGKLKPNWDSYNAEEISISSISKALETLYSLNKKGFLVANSIVNISVFPMRNGGIQFEFDSFDFSSELEIDNLGLLNYIKYNSSGNIISKIQLYEPSEITSQLIEISELHNHV